LLRLYLAATWSFCSFTPHRFPSPRSPRIASDTPRRFVPSSLLRLVTSCIPSIRADDPPKPPRHLCIVTPAPPPTTHPVDPCSLVIPLGSSLPLRHESGDSDSDSVPVLWLWLPSRRVGSLLLCRPRARSASGRFVGSQGTVNPTRESALRFTEMFRREDVPGA
jgi:hypothetical protein